MNLKNNLILNYYFLSLIIFSFFADDNSYLVENIIIPYIHQSFLGIHFTLSVVIIIMLFLIRTKKIIIDCILVFLISRIVCSLIPILYIDILNEPLGRLSVPIIALIAYYIGRQYTGQIDEIVKINVMFMIILSIQTIYTVVNMTVPYDYLYAQYIKIPLASSNLIAAYINPCIFLTLASYHGKSIIKFLLLIISFITIILTTSTGAILIFSFMILIYYIFLNQNINKRIKIVSGIILISSLTVFLWNYDSSLNTLTHGRSDLIFNDLEGFYNNVLFGNGMNYENRGSGTHNILIDLLYQNGIVGFILYIIPLTVIFTGIYSNKSIKTELLGCTLFLTTAFFESLIETSYFNYSNDMIFWFMAGITIAQIKMKNIVL